MLTIRRAPAVLLTAAITIGGALAPSVAQAARKAICEHPVDGVCTAVKDTGRITCQCANGEHELMNPDIMAANEQELLAACWDAWAEVCAPWDEPVSCEEPDIGRCELDGDDTECACDQLGDVSDDPVDGYGDLDAEGRDDACLEQLDRLCGTVAASPAMAPPPATEPATFGNSGNDSSVSCHVDPRGGSGWALALLGLLGLARRIRRQR